MKATPEQVNDGCQVANLVFVNKFFLLTLNYEIKMVLKLPLTILAGRKASAADNNFSSNFFLESS